jgi:hypothetical protein
MTIAKTLNSKVAEDIYNLGWDYVIEHVNGDIAVFCFLVEDGFFESVESLGLVPGDFILSDTLSF